jgi:hypothetical protein
MLIRRSGMGMDMDEFIAIGMVKEARKVGGRSNTVSVRPCGSESHRVGAFDGGAASYDASYDVWSALSFFVVASSSWREGGVAEAGPGVFEPAGLESERVVAVAGGTSFRSPRRQAACCRWGT